MTTLAWESFGEGWVTDAVKQLKLDPTVIRAYLGVDEEEEEVIAPVKKLVEEAIAHAVTPPDKGTRP